MYAGGDKKPPFSFVTDDGPAKSSYSISKSMMIPRRQPPPTPASGGQATRRIIHTLRKPTTPACAGAGCANKGSA